MRRRFILFLVLVATYIALLLKHRWAQELSVTAISANDEARDTKGQRNSFDPKKGRSDLKPEKLIPSTVVGKKISGEKTNIQHNPTNEVSFPKSDVSIPPSGPRFEASDYTLEQFRSRFRNKPLEQWLHSSKPLSYSNPQARKPTPNDVAAFVITGSDGRIFRYRQAMGLSAGNENFNDCVSVLGPDESRPVVGIHGESTLEVRETDVKWTYIITVNRRHFFVEHVDTNQLAEGSQAHVVLYYYKLNSQGKPEFQGEMTGQDEIQGLDYSQTHDSVDYCTHTYFQ